MLALASLFGICSFSSANPISPSNNRLDDGNDSITLIGRWRGQLVTSNGEINEGLTRLAQNLMCEFREDGTLWWWGWPDCMFVMQTTYTLEGNILTIQESRKVEYTIVSLTADKFARQEHNSVNVDEFVRVYDVPAPCTECPEMEDTIEEPPVHPQNGGETVVQQPKLPILNDTDETDEPKEQLNTNTGETDKEKTKPNDPGKTEKPKNQPNTTTGETGKEKTKPNDTCKTKKPKDQPNTNTGETNNPRPGRLPLPTKPNTPQSGQPPTQPTQPNVPGNNGETGNPQTDKHSNLPHRPGGHGGRLVPVSDGLYCYFDFDSNEIVDWQGRFTGINNGTTVSFDTPSGTGKSREFDGNSFVLAQGNIVPTNSPFSINIWFKTDTIAQVLVGSDNHGGGNRQSSLFITNHSNVRYFPNSYYDNWTTSGTISQCFDNQWHMMTLTYDGSIAIIYIDGAVFETKSSTRMAWGANVNNSYIGADVTNSTNGFFKGKLDNFRSYDRVLDATEIQTLYQARQ